METEQNDERLVADRNAKVLAGVDIHLGKMVRAWIALCGEKGLPMPHLTEGMRSADRQDRLYGQGRSEQDCKLHGVNPAYAEPKQQVVTRLTSRTSLHCKGQAVDWAAQLVTPTQRAKMCGIAVKCGLVSGFFWAMRDDCHLQLRADQRR